MTTKIHFTKMHGAGNDYIYVYTPDNPISNPNQAAIDWSRYHFGIGSDGLILIGKSDKADFSMRMFNNDGSEGIMCGNGIRCVGKYVYDHRLTDKQTVSIETLAGVLTLELQVSDGLVQSATVNMGEPILENKEQLDTPSGGMMAGQIEADGQTFTGTYVCMGNPHFIIFVDDVMSIPLTEIGPKLESHPIFPQRCNIEFAQIREDGSIRMRVWERGSGITMACGTGACATAVAAAINQLAGNQSLVEMDGGTLKIEWNKEDNHIYMTGPAATAFEGVIELEQ